MSAEDLTLKELREALEILTVIAEAMMHHTINFVKEPDHDCMEEYEDIYEDAPRFSDWDVQVMLAYEDAAMGQFKMLRAVMRDQGFNVTEEVGK